MTFSLDRPRKTSPLKRAVVAFVTAALGLFAAPSAPAQTGPGQEPPAALAGVHRVVCLGDSITQFGESPGGYVWLVRHYLADLYPGQQIETINAGISGNTSQDMIARFQRDVLDKKPDLVTISVGVNDVWHAFSAAHPNGDGPGGVSLDVFEKNVDSMVTQAQAAGARVVVLSTTVIYEDPNSPENQRVRAYNEALHDIARRHHAIWVDYQRPFWGILDAYHDRAGGRDNFLTVDGVHMNPAGNKVMAHTLLTGLGITPEAQRSVQDQVAREEQGQ